MEEKIMFEKTSILLMLGLMIISLGIYGPIWFLRRRDALNKLSSSEKLGSGAAIFVLVIFCISLLFIPILILSTDLSIAIALDVVDSLITLVGGIIMLVLAFKVRGILDDHCNKHLGMNVSFSGVATFFFTIFYLQYRMNRLPVLVGRNEEYY